MKKEEIGREIEKIQKVIIEKNVLGKREIERKAREIFPDLEFTGDDWIYDKELKEPLYPSETASIALTERDREGNIRKTGIAALYKEFPIIVADHTGVYFYIDGSIYPVTEATVLKETAQIRVHIFGQKARPHWIWMNQLISHLNKKGIRTENNMGPYFILRDYMFYSKRRKEGIKIYPIKAVIAEPFSNKPKEEIAAFIMYILSKKFPEVFFISDMAGQLVFKEDKIIKGEFPACPPYCASGWIAGTGKEIVFEVLKELKKAVEEIGVPEDTNEKIEKLISDLAHFK